MHKFTKEKHMKKILALLAATLYLLSPLANAQNTITGAGATFPFPITASGQKSTVKNMTFN
jgi:ABC-type phosphate transport system substrate-binding protein